MNSRRDFLKQAAALGAAGVLPAGIRRALAIDPAPGSTWQDAEHVVILMQENRSFDHCFGTLRGVRGFSDPRAITLPDGLPVWLQTNAAGETHAPFPLGMTKTKSTWMRSLPHSWADQTAARREGHHDRWLIAKAPGKQEYRHLPMTLGFYTRDDLPFYHALADAFTICDQNFCSSLTGTTPNRLYLWTGTVRAEPHPDSPACLRNSDVEYDREATWTTFPERLESFGIPWRVYQNELSLPTGLSKEEDPWLTNFTDNPLEWFTRYQVRFSPAHQAWLKNLQTELETLLADWKEGVAPVPEPPEISQARRQLEQTRTSLARWSPEAFAALPAEEQSLHRRAFTTNAGDPLCHRLQSLSYQEPGGPARTMQVPAGDVLHQFREDVRAGKLPAVSWLVAPQHFSDHPESPWYGAWYLAEAFDILTKNPDVWRKTIFILCYDENDGWFDHVPPPAAPAPGRPDTGDTSPGLRPELEYITAAQEAAWRQKNPKGALAEGPIGLGYRVPLVIASPWSRGGAVCSEVFDHTSIVQFLEKWLSHKTGREVREPNLSPWRRAVCGDLTSVFRPWQGEPVPLPAPVARTAWLGSLHEAQFKPLPGAAPLDPDELRAARSGGSRPLPRLPRQESGLRPSCALPYELAVTPSLSRDRSHVVLHFAAGTRRFGARSAGAAFHVYAPPVPGRPHPEIRPRAYTTAPGAEVSGSWALDGFPDRRCRLHVHGPNGFFRAWQLAASDPFITVSETVKEAEVPRHQLTLTIHGRQLSRAVSVRIADAAYGHPDQTLTLQPDPSGEASAVLVLDCRSAHGWYDLRLTLPDFPDWQHQLAGRIEDGLPGWSDPLLGA